MQLTNPFLPLHHRPQYQPAPPPAQGNASQPSFPTGSLANENPLIPHNHIYSHILTYTPVVAGPFIVLQL